MKISVQPRDVRSIGGFLAAVVVVMLAGSSAHATVPGSNGKLVCEGGRPDVEGVVRRQVFAINPDGTGESVLTDHPAADRDPSWSPDGTRIAFESFRDHGSEIYVMNADGSSVTRLTFNGLPEDRGAQWSPDGSRIVFHSARFPAAEPWPGTDNDLEIFTMDADGSTPIRLTNNHYQDAQANWSPDGTKIAFNSNRDTFDGGADHEIYVMAADGSSQTRLTVSPGEDAHPAWSPDGEKIIFHSRRDGPLNLYVMDAGGGNVTAVTDVTAPTHELFPVWSPDGTKISFTGDTLHPGQLDVYVADADGSNITPVTDSPGSEFDGRCDWQRASPTEISDCLKGGWQQYNTPEHTLFRNQGQCVAWATSTG